MVINKVPNEHRQTCRWNDRGKKEKKNPICSIDFQRVVKKIRRKEEHASEILMRRITNKNEHASKYMLNNDNQKL